MLVHAQVCSQILLSFHGIVWAKFTKSTLNLLLLGISNLKGNRLMSGLFG
ncbi:hypothetical protein MXB_3123 [Myxobolus squamalis]|nr:hypothetical protein MXB_3123 [Myxobolus squamalis]